MPRGVGTVSLIAQINGAIDFDSNLCYTLQRYKKKRPLLTPRARKGCIRVMYNNFICICIEAAQSRRFFA